MHVLVTGGLGYIGSHTVVTLLENNYEITIVDNLSNSSVEVLNRIKTITGERPDLYRMDLQEKEKLEDVFASKPVDAVIHFAGLKAVGESVQDPLQYYRVNLDSTLSLLEAMKQHNVHKLVFSSSATVYGSASVPYSEESSVGQGITSPYGQTKYMIEQILRDVAATDKQAEFSILRYFNPVGAHKSGHIGEHPKGTPNNLMPFIAQVAAGERDNLSIFGNDYPTPDGTCIRDYIHVVDLAEGHVAALKNLEPGVATYNLGSGIGTSVLELINAFTKSTGQNIPYTFAERRKGDLPAFYANPSQALAKLGWKTKRSIEDMCRDTWNWQSKNPTGYSL